MLLRRLTSSRPTHAHIERLQEELRQLKDPTTNSPQVKASSSDRDAAEEPDDAVQTYQDETEPTPASTGRSHDPSSRYLTVSHSTHSPPTGPSTPCGPSTYHGPTSASHDGAVHERRPQRWFTAEREALMPNLLFAAAARSSMLS